jgi:hypothetical protein
MKAICLVFKFDGASRLMQASIEIDAAEAVEEFLRVLEAT